VQLRATSQPPVSSPRASSGSGSKCGPMIQLSHPAFGPAADSTSPGHTHVSARFRPGRADGPAQCQQCAAQRPAQQHGGELSCHGGACNGRGDCTHIDWIWRCRLEFKRVQCRRQERPQQWPARCKRPARRWRPWVLLPIRTPCSRAWQPSAAKISVWTWHQVVVLLVPSCTADIQHI
jgi:hypothetical protein